MSGVNPAVEAPDGRNNTAAQGPVADTPRRSGCKKFAAQPLTA